MCKSSVYSLFLSLNVTGTLPKGCIIGCIVAPFATFGMMLDGKTFLLAAKISAPESGRDLVRVEPLEEVMLMLTFEAGSVQVTWWILDSIVLGISSTFAEAEVSSLLGSEVGLLWQTNFGKMANFLAGVGGNAIRWTLGTTTWMWPGTTTWVHC